MRVLIGYDGSEHADAALDDLARAGLPDETEIRLIAVADVWPAPAEAGQADASSATATLVRRAYELAEQTMKDANLVVSKAAEQLRGRFARWNIKAEAMAGSATTALVYEARNWRADLVVVGAAGRGAIGRAILGSVSQSVITHAPCSVRIGRPRRGKPDQPIRIIVGLDGSSNSAAALHAVTLRRWPAGTEARVVIARDIRIATAIPSLSPDITWPMPAAPDEQAWPREAADAAARELSAAGLSASPIVRDGDPKRVLVEEADTWQADCIFVGARGVGRLDGFLLGSVSSAVAARANCSVEVVRFE